MHGPCILRQGCDCGMGGGYCDAGGGQPGVRLGRALQRSWVV
jgi:hypothetical protein